MSSSTCEGRGATSSIPRKAKRSHANAKRVSIALEAAFRSILNAPPTSSVHLVTCVHPLSASTLAVGPRHLPGYNETEQPAGAAGALKADAVLAASPNVMA